MNLERKIEAILFHQAEPVKKSRLAGILGVSEDNISRAVDGLEHSLTGRGVQLIRLRDQLALGTATETADLIEALTKEELSKELSKAALETLAIIAYQGEISRAAIDYIRGVNSSFILRNLMIRGLIERIPDPKDGRGYLYRPTFDLLAHLGINKISELPEFKAAKTEIRGFMTRSANDDNADES